MDESVISASSRSLEMDMVSMVVNVISDCPYQICNSEQDAIEAGFGRAV